MCAVHKANFTHLKIRNFIQQNRQTKHILEITYTQARSQTTPIGVTENFRGATVTGHRTQLTIAITGSTTTMKIGVQNNAASRVSIKNFALLCTHSGVH